MATQATPGVLAGERLPMGVAMSAVPSSKRGTYFELSEETLDLIEAIKNTTGLPKNRVIELAIRELARDRTVHRQLSIDEFLKSRKNGEDDEAPTRKHRIPR